ncbi:unnamed protein product [Sphagnum jensenii]|uniref:Uncharacterized protein n=1 Tax=Sphagnum jensenii TaxID=128206 RepID=A0ABP0VTI0_9BRYO
MGPENRNRRFSSKDGKVKVAADSKDPVATNSAEQEVASPNYHGDEIQGATINLQLHIRDMSQALGTEREGGRQGMTATCALDFGRYSEIFELNEVDNAVLPLLTMDDDLRENGH